MSGRTFRFAIHSSVDLDARRGIDLAAADANSKARQLGASVEISSSGVDSAGLWGVVSGADYRVPRSNVPVICVSADPERTGTSVFSIAPAAEARRAALLAWRTAHDDAREDLELVEWHPELRDYGAADLNARFMHLHRRPMTAPAWRGYFAVKALTETALRRATANDRCRAVLDAEFDGHKGARLLFDRATRVLRQPLYVVRQRESRVDVIGEVR